MLQINFNLKVGKTKFVRHNTSNSSKDSILLSSGENGAIYDVFDYLNVKTYSFQLVIKHHINLS